IDRLRPVDLGVLAGIDDADGVEPLSAREAPNDDVVGERAGGEHAAAGEREKNAAIKRANHPSPQSPARRRQGTAFIGLFCAAGPAIGWPCASTHYLC